MDQKKPLLSIGMIFKNESRCLERCLKSLEPLRKAIPCELVMADTGATDGSREIAAQYADVLFDFPWINDFAAARNAVIDRCSGKWFMTIDCDEWLHHDISGLVKFVRTDKRYNYCALIIRNYKTTELEKSGNYSDFIAARIVRMSAGLRYEGKIHEHWPAAKKEENIMLLKSTILHHDGYVLEDEAQARAKMDRNLQLLRQELEEKPDSLITLLQCIESSDRDREANLSFVRRAADAVERKVDSWEKIGPAIFRYAVTVANGQKLPELSKWIERAETWFPDSMYTRVDVNYVAFGYEWNRGNYQACATRAEKYFQAVRDMDAGAFDQSTILFSGLLLASTDWRNNLKVFHASAYLYLQQPEKALDVIKNIDASLMDVKQVKNFTRVLVRLQGRSNLNITKDVRNFWNTISRPEPSEERAAERKDAFLKMADTLFSAVYRNNEKTDEQFCRYAYTLLLPLETECVQGLAAAVLSQDDPSVLEEKLAQVKTWADLPLEAIGHALVRGVRFPLEKNPLYLEQMDELASRLSNDRDVFFEIVAGIKEVPENADFQTLSWLRALAMAAVSACDWQDMRQGDLVSRLFAEVENQFIPRYYCPDLLSKQNAMVLPPLHRFGWYYIQALEAQKSGDMHEYVQILREGLQNAPTMKGMVAFLLEQAKGRFLLQKQSANPELLELAGKVKIQLDAMRAAGTPGIDELMRSPAYQKLKPLIEGLEVWGE